jgi:ATP-dependent RNA helicase RhlE
MSKFAEFQLLPSILKTLSTLRITKPTEVQELAIPLLTSGGSIVGIAETGSGKTLAYALPILDALKKLENAKDLVKENSKPRAVVVVPSRDLGEQVSKVFKSFTHETRLRVRPALGGTEFEQVRRSVAGPFEVLIATPGRLLQLIEKKLIDLKDVRTLIFDEADQMLDEGFLPDSNIIVKFCPEGVQLGLFSATVSPSVQELMNTLFSSAQVFRSSGAGKTVKTLVTKNLFVENGKRWPLMEKVLATKTEGGTLVFVNTREQCDTLARELTEKGFSCSVYRGEMDKNERRGNLKKFRAGEIDLLISTDLAGRGLDVESVGRVINFHLPKEMDNYLHRVGRTARAGRSGLVVNLITERDQPLMDKLHVKRSAEGEGRRADQAARPKAKSGKPLKPMPSVHSKSYGKAKSKKR